MFYRTFIAFLLLSCWICSDSLHARHIVGGDGTYTFVRYNADSTRITYLIRFNLYRDSNGGGAELARNELFGIYREFSPGEWEYVDEFTAQRPAVDRIPIIDEPCREEPNNVGVEAGYYEREVTLDVIDQNYMIAYLRCCRNDNIINVDAFEMGAVFDLVITPEAQRTGNNSPTFDEFPPIFICTSFPLDVSLACSDIEGDSLVYSFCPSLAVGGTRPNNSCESGINPDRDICPPPYDILEFNSPYSDSAPMAGNPIVRIDANTGLITGTPELNGQYVLSICVEEYRNGILLSQLRRDFQFNSITCIKELSANLVADEVVVDVSTGQTVPISIIKACGDSLVQFRGIDASNTIINYAWNVFDPLGELVVDTSGRDVRNLEVYFPELGEYVGTLAVEDIEGCTDTAVVTVLRLPDMISNFEYEVLDSCYRGAIQFTDLSSAEESQIVEWEWDFGGEATSTDQNPSYEFDDRGVNKVTLVSKDLNTCIDTSVYFVEYEPPHDRLLESAPDITLCFGDSIFFANQWIYEAGNYEEIVQYVETGCDSIYRSLTLDFYIEPTETYLDTILCPGETLDYFGVNYNASQIETTGMNDFNHSTLSLVTGCDSIVHFIRYDYEELPVINFTAEDQYVVANKAFRMPISITGNFDETFWTPRLGLDCDDCPYPNVNSDEDTTYVIKLITDDDCEVVDSIFLDFVVVPERYYIPTVVSSNSLLNVDRSFYLMTQENAFEEVTYSMKIFDRWGGLLFDGKDLNINDESIGWQPRTIAPGAYAYTIEIKEFFETQFLVGTITIIE